MAFLARVGCADVGNCMRRARGVDNEDVDLSRIAPPSSRTEDMMYLGDLGDGWYAFTNTRQKVGFGMRWSLEMHPYLWYWQCFNGPNPQPSFGRAYAVGIEPWSTPPYTLERAISDGTALKASSGELLETQLLAVAYHGLERVNGKPQNSYPRSKLRGFTEFCPTGTGLLEYCNRAAPCGASFECGILRMLSHSSHQQAGGHSGGCSKGN
jgi:hypothetical protein